MRTRTILVACCVLVACSDPPPPPAPKAPEKPSKGEWTTKAEAGFTALSAADPKSPEAEKGCVTARSAATMARDRAETAIADIATKIDERCALIDAWATMLRLVPQADGPNRVAYCTKVSVAMKKLEAQKVDVTALAEEHKKLCKAKAAKFEPTGALAKVDDLDPRGKEAKGLCLDARTAAFQVKLRDRTEGEEQERTLNVVCALPDLFASLEIAANGDKPQDARDNECISARVWIGALTKNKRLKGKYLGQAKSAFKSACKKWQKGDPMKLLAKVEKLDPKSKEARGLCGRAGAYVAATEAAGIAKDIKEARDKACVRVEAWFVALDGPCATAADRLDNKKSLLDPAELKSMTDEQRERCK